MSRWLTTLVVLLAPPRLKPPLLNLLGHRVHRTAHIGFSLIRVRSLNLSAKARIGALNYINCGRVLLREGAYIGRANLIRGPLDLRFGPEAKTGDRNIVRRGRKPMSFGPAQFRLGRITRMSGEHYIDCTQSVVIGDYSQLAGKGSQLWTHGYIHMSDGVARARIDGKITIGKNVYVGSHCCLTGGITIADAVTIGSHSSVAASLTEPGLYVSQPLRYLPLTPEQRLEKLPQVTADGLTETVYWKGSGAFAPGSRPTRARKDR